MAVKIGAFAELAIFEGQYPQPYEHSPQTFLFLAVTGWLCSVVVHLLAVSGIDAAAYIPQIWIFHIGTFVVLLPAILSLTANKPLHAYLLEQRAAGRGKGNFSMYFRLVFAQTPAWMVALAGAGLIYAIINFMAPWQHAEFAGGAQLPDGSYAVTNHGQVIRPLTYAEFLLGKTVELRRFSGDWIAFYGAAAAILYPFGGSAANEN